MDLIFLVVTLILTLIVFGADASQKRNQYLNSQESEWKNIF
jgi:hypothetical protein